MSLSEDTSRNQTWNTLESRGYDLTGTATEYRWFESKIECLQTSHETVVDGLLKRPGTLCDYQYVLGLTCREKDFEYHTFGVVPNNLVENHTHEPTAPRPGNKGNTAAQQQRISGESDKSVRSNYGTVSKGCGAMDKTLFG